MADLTTGSFIIPSPSLAQLLREYNINNAPVLTQPKNPYLGQITDSAKDQALYLSQIGTPVVADLTIKSVSYTDFVKNIKYTTPEVVFVIVLLNVSRAKKIVKTEINNHDGTIKEYIGLDDYHVQINGICVAQNGVHPAAAIQQIRRIVDAPVSFPVVSTYLNNLGIFNLVVEDHNLDQAAGNYSRQDFSISCISDDPIELQLQ